MHTNEWNLSQHDIAVSILIIKAVLLIFWEWLQIGKLQLNMNSVFAEHQLQLTSVTCLDTGLSTYIC